MRLDNLKTQCQSQPVSFGLGGFERFIEDVFIFDGHAAVFDGQERAVVYFCRGN